MNMPMKSVTTHEPPQNVKSGGVEPVEIDIRNVSLSFGTTEVLKGIDLKIEPGEFFAFLGPSGSGKSTLLRAIAGFGPTRDTVPAPLRQAVLRLACRWFEHRGDVVSRDAMRLPAEIAALVAPFRRVRL